MSQPVRRKYLQQKALHQMIQLHLTLYHFEPRSCNNRYHQFQNNQIDQ